MYYEFKSIETNKIIVLFYHYNDVPKIGEIIKDAEGKHWKRVASSVMAAVDTVVDPYSKKSFNKILENKNVTHGTLWDVSKEMSERRTEKDGFDAVKDKFDQNREDTLGIPTPASKQKAARERLKKLGVTLKSRGKRKR